MKHLVPETTLIKPLDFFLFEEAKKSLCLTLGLIYLDLTVEELAFNIDYYYKKQFKEKIVFSDYYEAPNSSQLILMNKIILKLCEKYDYKVSDFIFLSGCLPTKDNTKKLDDLFIKYNLVPIKKVIYPYFEIEWSKILNTSTCNFNILHNRKIRDKKGLYFTGAMRAHRIYILSKLIELDLIKETLYSVLQNRQTLEEALNCFSPRHDNDFIFNNKDTLKSFILRDGMNYPHILTAELGQHSRQHELNEKDLELFASTYFSIIGETSFFINENFTENFTHWNFHLNYTFCTEKTFRAIACLHPFIITGRPYTLRGLREMGYKTFSPYIDESYDKIIDDDLRLTKIIEIIKNLYSKTPEEWLQFQQDIYPIVCHNYNHLKHAIDFAKYINVDTYSTT